MKKKIKKSNQRKSRTKKTQPKAIVREDSASYLVEIPRKQRSSTVALSRKYAVRLVADETTDSEVIEARLLGRQQSTAKNKPRDMVLAQGHISFVRNTVILDDSEDALLDLPSQSIDLIFTSPPYYNARPEYEDYLSYESYLLKMRRIIHNCHRVLAEGRFFVMNVSPVLIRRANRNEASKITGEYDTTNLWRIHPAFHRKEMPDWLGGTG